jgi:hypothetical protein
MFVGPRKLLAVVACIGATHALQAVSSAARDRPAPRRSPEVRAKAAPGPATAVLTVAYTGLTPEAQAAFQTAVDIWAHTIVSAYPIRINAFYAEMPLDPHTFFGIAGATTYCTLTGGDTFYPAALADVLNGAPFCATLHGQTHEIEASFNSKQPDLTLSMSNDSLGCMATNGMMYALTRSTAGSRTGIV